MPQIFALATWHTIFTLILWTLVYPSGFPQSCLIQNLFSELEVKRIFEFCVFICVCFPLEYCQMAQVQYNQFINYQTVLQKIKAFFVTHKQRHTNFSKLHELTCVSNQLCFNHSQSLTYDSMHIDAILLYLLRYLF